MSVVVENAVFYGFGVRANLYVFSLYRNPDLDDRFFVFFTSINGSPAG